jgi:hypothetical protein
VSTLKTLDLGKPSEEDKKQVTDWVKIFANHISHKGLTSRTQKEVPKANNENINGIISK